MNADQKSEFTRSAVGVVALCFVLNTTARGCGEIFAVFFGPLLDEFGWGRATTASLYSAFMIALGFSSPVVGALFDRYGGRTVYVGGLLAYGSGFLIAAGMTELWQGWLGLGLLVGLGAAATGMTPATGLISRWFERNLAFAISFAYSGFAFGAVLLAPLAGQMIEAEGWRWTYQVFGLALIGLAAVVLILPWRRIGQGIKPSPPRRSLIPDRRVLSEVPFWGLFTIFFMTSVATYVVQVPSVVYLEEAGYSTFTATLVYGVNSMMSVVGILCAGWLSDRFGPRAIASLGYSLSIIGIIALAALAAGPNPVLLGLFLFCFGGAMGSRGPIVSSVTARLFEGQVGAVFGLITIGLGLGGAFGAWISGWLFEQTGGYLAGFGVAGAASLIGMAIFWVIPEVGQGRRRLA